jgi:hypothetical protein
MDCEVWLVGSLNLTMEEPLAVASVDEGRFRIGTGAEPGAAWLFLRQRGLSGDGAPYQLFMPLSLDPFDLADPPRKVRLIAAPEQLASLRETGEPMPDWWLIPSLLCVLIFGLGLLLRWAIRWRIDMATGAGVLLSVIEGGEGGKARPTTPLATDIRVAPMGRNRPPAPPLALERRAISVILAVAAALRLPRLLGTSFDLLEHTYGPGSIAVGEQRGLLELLFIQPSAVEVTHPPLYHWLLMALGTFGEPEWLLRSPAFLASLGTVYLLWRLFRRFHHATGLAAAAAFAIAAPAIHFGADATPYAFVGLILIGSFILLLRALERGSSAAWRAWLGLLTVGFLSHYVTALFGLAQIGAVLVVCAVRYRSVAWLGALHRATGAGLLLAPLPLAWAFVHFAWFAPVALDTRLFADTYPADPGLVAFFGQFVAVATGVSPDSPLLALPLVLLAAVGWFRWYSLNRPFALVVLATLCSFAFGTLFLYYSLLSTLGQHIFWGFRWVSWIQPLLVGLAALAIVPWHGRGWVRALGTGLALLWLFSALRFTVTLDDHTRRPDHHAAAELLSEHMMDRDSITPLPMWAHRGPLTSYLAASSPGSFGETHGVMAWNFGGRAIFLESASEGLPFESSAINSHVQRLWLLNIDERMFGRSKFSSSVAERALAWADQQLVPTGPPTELSNLSVHLYTRPEAALLWDGLRPFDLTVPEVDIRSIPWLEPNMPGCDRGREDQEPHWVLNVRVPVTADLEGVVPHVAEGEWQQRTDPGHISGRIVGGPCSSAPPRFKLPAQVAERPPPTQRTTSAEKGSP